MPVTTAAEANAALPDAFAAAVMLIEPSFTIEALAVKPLATCEMPALTLATAEAGPVAATELAFAATMIAPLNPAAAVVPVPVPAEVALTRVTSADPLPALANWTMPPDTDALAIAADPEALACAPTSIVPSLASDAEALPPTSVAAAPVPSEVAPANALCAMPAPTNAEAYAGPLATALALAPTLIVPLLVRTAAALPCRAAVAAEKAAPPVVVTPVKPVAAGFAAASW